MKTKLGHLLGKLSARRTIYHLERGHFKSLLGKAQAESFWKFAYRQALIPHSERVVLRLTMDHKGTPWFLWAVYKITNTDPGEMKLVSLMAPDGAENALKKPDEIGLVYYRA